MKDLRKILPRLSLTFSLGLLALLLGSILMAATSEAGSHTVDRFAIKSMACEEQPAFTYSAVEGEVENSDNDSRQKDEIIPMLGLMMQSRMISNFIHIIQHQLAATLVIRPRLTILFSQFLV